MSMSIHFDQILIKIWDATAGELKHLRRPKPRIKKLEEAMANLRAKADDIENSISLAQLEGEIPTSEIKLWLRKVEELNGKAAAIEQDFQSCRCLGAWSCNCFSVNRRVAKRMKEIETTNTTVPPITIKKLPPSVVEIPTSNSPLAIEAYKSTILGYIASPNATEVISVYGMGGVGKTTILKSINNHHKNVARFDHVIWVVASRGCKVEKLQRDIANRLDLNLKQDDSEEGCAAKLFEFLKNKDSLLLLDDLWEQLDLAMLGMVHASSLQGEQQKRKVVVFTTRDKQVCGAMKASREMEIKCLEPKDAWELFQSKANDAIGSDVGIERIARQIVQECAGLPLALITVSSAMSRKKSWEEWKHTLTLLKHSQMPKVTGKADAMFSAFKLSYDSLEDDDMRGSLLSCALWPEDHLINKEKLIECWMGLGLIDEAGAIHNAYNRGHSHIETLKAACLLEPGDDKEREVKMHDVIRDMALWMASDCGKKKFKWIVRAGVAARQAFEEEGWHAAERVSLMYNKIASLPNQLSTCSKLSMLMLQFNKELLEIHGTLIQAMCSLTYLDLQYTGITKLPKEIGLLSQLRHLNLSNTQIEELPVELGCLGKLNYLFLGYMYKLKIVAKGAISSLSSLKFLDLSENKHMDLLIELEGLTRYQKCSVSIDITTVATLQRLCSLPHVLIWRLNLNLIDESSNLNQLLGNIVKSRNIWQSMDQLEIKSALSNELLISEGNEEDGGFECLKYLALHNLFELEEITWKGVLPQILFPNLRELIIEWCMNLRNVNWVLQLPSLSFLEIRYCDAMEELISDEGSSSPSCFGLRRLRLIKMNGLRGISCRPLYFPNLEEMEVKDCPLLRKMSFDKVNRLKVIRCGQGLWDNLEWEDESIKNSLSPLVTFGKELLPLAVEQIPTSHSMVGIEECMRIILGHIASPNATEVIGVYGMAGVGKTTLLRRINNHINVSKFDYVIWVVASRECEMERLQQDIAKSLCLHLAEDDIERDRASKLFDRLENSDCLLLLDDLWAPLDLTKLAMARATPGQRKQKRKVVVFTTRNKQICNDMNVGMKIEIKCLEPEQAWQLFQRKAGEDFIRSDAEIDHIAHQIAEECSGLPLALITVGMAMSTNKSLEVWNNALTLMKKEANPMFSTFKLSYKSLEDDDMRDRLLSCALWPEYFSINKDELIECWMGLGLIDEEGGIQKAIKRGHSHIETLKAACLLEPGNDEEMEVKMHDRIRDMALWIASDCGKKKFKWIIRGGLVASKELEEEKWHEAERVSLMTNHITSLPNQLSSCLKLSVLMLQHNGELEEIRGTLIQAMCSLTYLDLENTGIAKIPKEIGMLSQLRHLNLSRTKIKELPVELGYLNKLNYLFLRYNLYLKRDSMGVISRLSSLKFLDLRESGHMNWLDDVEGLKGCQKYSIGIDIWTAIAFQRLCSLPNVLILDLKVVFFHDLANPNQLLDDIIKSCNTTQSMERLRIINVGSKELLVSEGNKKAGGLECLKYLEFHWLTDLEEITWKRVLPQIVFPNLCELHISFCDRLRNVNWVCQLPSLSVLEIQWCNAMEELISEEGNSSCSSFALRKMALHNMDNLKRIASRPLNFPYLEEIEVQYCPHLIKLPFKNQISVNRLKVIRCQKKWWDKLEWEDVSIKDTFLPLVRRCVRQLRFQSVF